MGQSSGATDGKNRGSARVAALSLIAAVVLAFAAVSAAPADAAVCKPCETTWLGCKECNSFKTGSQWCYKTNYCQCKNDGGCQQSADCTGADADESCLDYQSHFDSDTDKWVVAEVHETTGTLERCNSLTPVVLY